MKELPPFEQKERACVCVVYSFPVRQFWACGHLHFSPSQSLCTLFVAPFDFLLVRQKWIVGLDIFFSFFPCVCSHPSRVSGVPEKRKRKKKGFSERERIDLVLTLSVEDKIKTKLCRYENRQECNPDLQTNHEGVSVLSRRCLLFP